MHRVELKEQLQAGFVKVFGEFLMHRVELKVGPPGAEKTLSPSRS